ncbi:MAG: potassium/proton antiporter [Pseudomonadota bacterium]
MTTEPQATAWILTVLGALLAVSVLLSRALARTGIPVVLLFLALGMLAGSQGIGGIRFVDHGLTFRLGTVALALILFDGGLNTPLHVVERNLGPAAVLATLGVVATAALLGLAAWALGFPRQHAFLLGAVVSSTDAAAVFSILRGSGIQLKRRVGGTLEVESGLNDPMAVILTVALTEGLSSNGDFTFSLLLVRVVAQLAVGGVAGLLVGHVGRILLRRPVLAGGLYPVLTLSVACLAYGLATLVFGSGFLAVYVAALVLGSGRLPYRSGVLRAHDFVGWFSQIVMFVALGLLSFPAHLAEVAPLGLALAGFLALVARPVAVFLCLAPFRFAFGELVYVSWVGLRGAVPIILAAYPVMAGVQGSGRIFDVVFFVVVVSAFVQGGSIRWLTRRLGLLTVSPLPPPAVLEITSTSLLDGEIMTFYIGPASAVSGATVGELPFPAAAAAMLIVRGSELIAPKGLTRIEPGDYVYVFSRREDQPFMRLLFGQEENR